MRAVEDCAAVVFRARLLTVLAGLARADAPAHGGAVPDAVAGPGVQASGPVLSGCPWLSTHGLLSGLQPRRRVCAAAGPPGPPGPLGSGPVRGRSCPSASAHLPDATRSHQPGGSLPPSWASRFLSTDTNDCVFTAAT